MSKITTVYDYMLSSLSTLFPGKTKMPNPYSITDNNYQLMRDSYGLKTQGHSVSGNQINFLIQEYVFRVVFCREVVRLDSETSVFDTETKAIEEDVFTARKFFYDVDSNGLPGTIDQVFLGGTDPITFFVTSKNNFIFTETTLLLRIREQIANC